MTHLPMITNDEAVELLDYIAMNDLENAYDAKRCYLSRHVRQLILRNFRILRTIRRRASLLILIALSFKFNQ
jgi:hypothetical protein